MRSKLHAATWLAAFFFLTLSSCKKDKAPVDNLPFDRQLLKGGTWMDYQNSSSSCTMKFRFYGNTNVTYSFRTAVYPSLKYDSFPGGRWEFIQPDTLRLYDRSWNCYGYLQVLGLSDTELRSRIPGNNDVIVFKKEK